MLSVADYIKIAGGMCLSLKDEIFFFSFFFGQEITSQVIFIYVFKIVMYIIKLL